jgi:hypothetical protein
MTPCQYNMTKMLLKTSVIFLALLMVSCASGNRNDQNNLNRVLEKGGDALANKVVLTEIREGQLTNAIEALEFSIDSSVVILGKSLESPSTNQEQILSILKQIKDYRQKFPRAITASGKDGESQEEISISRKAEEILRELP